MAHSFSSSFKPPCSVPRRIIPSLEANSDSEVRYGITTQVEEKNDNHKLHGIRFKSTICNICG